jgi:pyruvate dehydrogenase E1 component
LFSAATRRYVDAHFGERPAARFIATVGDAELDEGNVWEAIADPTTAGLANVTLIVDLNRQSLDRVIPDIHAIRLQQFFADAGWHVTEAKYGSKLTAAFKEPGGDALRGRIDEMSNEAYQAMFALEGSELRDKFLTGADKAVKKLARQMDDASLKSLVTDLGGHDLGLLVDTFRECDLVSTRPSVVFAYTVKGWSLPIAGDPMNHSALLSSAQIDDLRTASGLTPDTEWGRLDPASPAGQLCAKVGSSINNPGPVPRPRPPVPASTAKPQQSGTTSTQEAFGRTMARLGDIDGVKERIVTTAPAVSISTNLGGWINKRGVFSPDEREDHGGSERLLKWAPSPDGQHIELGISEMNLFMMLGQLGLSHDHHGEHLLPVGTVYDPFVLRGLDSLIYSLYNAARFIVTGTPSGVTLAPEGGAHQSTITASVGLELPAIHYVEPTYATEVDWLLCDALDQLSTPDGQSCYLRLSTRPIDQAPFAVALGNYGEVELKYLVLAGGYRLVSAPVTDRPGVTLVSTGATIPNALLAAQELDREGVDATVVHLTSPDRIYRSWKQRHDAPPASTGVSATSDSNEASLLHRLVPVAERNRPVVSVHDAASHALAWVGSALGTPQTALGVDQFGESGTVEDLHDITGISAGHIVNAALLALDETL